MPSRGKQALIRNPKQDRSTEIVRAPCSALESIIHSHSVSSVQGSSLLLDAVVYIKEQLRRVLLPSSLPLPHLASRRTASRRRSRSLSPNFSNRDSFALNLAQLWRTRSWGATNSRSPFSQGLATPGRQRRPTYSYSANAPKRTMTDAMGMGMWLPGENCE